MVIMQKMNSVAGTMLLLLFFVVIFLISYAIANTLHITSDVKHADAFNGHREQRVFSTL